MHHSFKVYNQGKHIDTVFSVETNPKEVRRSLINHDGYSDSILVLACWRTDYIIQGHYGHGWEDECSETSHKEAIDRLREYQENSPYPSRLIKRKVQV